MAKRQRIVEGAFVKIPLDENRHAYGRLLKRPLVGFYESDTAEDLPLAVIQSMPVSFKVWVANRAITSGRWEIVGVAPLEEELKSDPRFFKFDTIQKELSIYHQQRELPASWEECKDLECAAVWSAEHVEDRLRDRALGRPNKWAESMKPPIF